MSDPRIRAALEYHLETMVPAIATSKQGQEFTPPTSDPYQEIYLMPARNFRATMSSGTTLHRGILQVNLCYPAGVGTGVAEQRGLAVQERFAAESTVLTDGGITVRITAKPSFGNAQLDRPGVYLLPVFIPYESIF